MMNLSGKTALITGSTQGIGYAIAKAFCAAGARVFVHCSSDAEKAEKIRAELGAYGAVTADLSKIEETKMLAAKTGELDILVLNASVQYRTAWDEITEEEFDCQINVNLKSTLLLMQAYIPAMQKKGFGRVITIGSVQQSKPHAQMAVYAATKTAVVNLIKNVAKQVAGDGVTVNNIAPGVIATPRNEAALSDAAYAKKVLDGIPMGVAGDAADLAGAALLLASDEGRYITGVDLYVDGGMSL